MTDLFKIINPRTHVLDDGRLFPFLSSTDLFPEWPLATFPHVSHTVSLEVQAALLALSQHAEFAINNGTQMLRCDTTSNLAELSLQAKTAALLTRFRTALSYDDIRSKQQALDFLYPDRKGGWHCASEESLYEDVDCPDGFFKLSEKEFFNSCQDRGLDCKGRVCFCNPCVKAFEVDVYQIFNGSDNATSTDQNKGCEKMSICGQIEQTKTIVLRVVDNSKRDDVNVEAWMHDDRLTEQVEITSVQSEPYSYEIRWSNNFVEVGVLEIYFDKVQISESPIRIQVEPRDCQIDFPGQSLSYYGINDLFWIVHAQIFTT